MLRSSLPNVTDLQKLLEDTTFTQDEISEATGVSVSLLRAIKRGRRLNPTIKTYRLLREFLESKQSTKKRPAPDQREAA